ncbi:MAG: hypothetical protein V4655_09530 [Bdellovibrionota bacterium]|nr:MAG: hypothetical protein EOP10_25745 [Pseudomonadota bacterium]
MLKRMTLNGRRIPVPVPIQDLQEAVEWLQKHLVRPDHAITRIELNGEDIDFSSDGECRVAAVRLAENSDLRVKVDSPSDICLQTLDVLRNLSSVIGRNLKPIAVKLWEHKGSRLPVETAAIFDDFTLMQELLDHILLLLDKQIDATNVCSIQAQLNKAFTALNYAVQSADWKATAKVLLNQIETPANELSNELSSVEKVIFERVADRNMERPRKISGPNVSSINR